MMQNELAVKRHVAHVGEEIDHDLAAQMVNDYQKANPDGNNCHLIGREIIEKILAQPGCEGIRFFNAYNEYGQKTLVYVGVGKDRRNLIEYTVVTQTGAVCTQKAIVADRTEGPDEKDSWWNWIKFW